MLGKTFRSGERLVTVFDDIISRAELVDDVHPPAILQLALHNALAAVERAAPPTLHSRKDHARGTASSHARDVGEQHECGDGADVQMRHVEQSQSTGPDDHTHAGAAPPVADVVKPRFRDAEKFYLHHAVRAKKSTLVNGWVQESDREVVRHLAKAEWTKLDMRTKSEWEELFTQWTRGDETTLELAAAAHMFRDGMPAYTWSISGTESPMAETNRSAHCDQSIASGQEDENVRIHRP